MAAALRSEPSVRVADALAIVKRMLVAGADPNAMNLQVASVATSFPGKALTLVH